MIQVTISLPDSVYAWLADRAAESRSSVEAMIVEQVKRLPEGERQNREFLKAVEAVIAENGDLLKRLAE